MKTSKRSLLLAMVVLSSSAMLLAQAPAAAKGKGKGGPPQSSLSVSTSAWPDGGEIPLKHAFRGENKSPAFEFHWNQGTNPGTAPEALQSYAIIFRDMENSTARTTVDTLHWSAYNIPGTAKGIPEGLAAGTLPDGTVNGPGIARRGDAPGSYFGPGAGPGPFHHYVFEFFALDTKLTLPDTASREDLIKAMDGHVIGKAIWVGRFHSVQ